MKNKLTIDIQDTIKEYELYSYYIKTNYKPDMVNKLDRVNIGSANMKKYHLCIKAIVLSDLYEKEFNEVFDLGEELNKEKLDYMSKVNSISLVNDKLDIGSELKELISKVDNEIKKNGKEAK